MSLRRWDKDLYASDATTRDCFDWSDANLLILPILSRNPMGGSATLNCGQAALSASSNHRGFRPRHLGGSVGGTGNVNNSSIDQR